MKVQCITQASVFKCIIIAFQSDTMKKNWMVDGESWWKRMRTGTATENSKEEENRIKGERGNDWLGV